MKNFIWKLIGVWCFMLVLGNVYSQSIAVSDKKCANDTTKFTLLLDTSIPTTSLQTSIQWSFGDNTANFNATVLNTTIATATHVYTVGTTYTAKAIITYSGTYPQQTVYKTVVVNKGPDVSFNYGRYEGACKNESLVLEVNTYGKNYVLWSTGDTYDGSKGIIKFPVPAAGLYKAVAFDDNLCQTPVDGQNTEEAGVTTVTFFEYPEIESLDTLQVGDALQITLTPKNNGYSETVKYVWSTPDGGSVTDLGSNKYLVSQKGTYTVTATQVHKLSSKDVTCTATKSLTVKRIADAGNESTKFDAYNTFVPNFAGASATWTLKTPENITWYQNCKLTIYNSWGQVVYTKERIGTDVNIWYGTTGDNGTGKPLPTDTYYYIVKCSNCNCEPAPQSNTHTGSVTIIRK